MSIPCLVTSKLSFELCIDQPTLYLHSLYFNLWSPVLRLNNINLQEPYKTQLEPMLLQFVIPVFDSPLGHLRAKVVYLNPLIS